MIASWFRAPSRLLVPIMATVLIGSRASAQSVDITQELKEDREPETPVVRVHPWRWLHDRWLEETEHLDRLVGLQVGLTFTTIYQHAAGLRPIFDPALQPSRSFVAVFGLRSRLSL